MNGYVTHAPIEPHTATARLEGGKITVWASAQSPFGAKDLIAQTLGMPEKDVRVITPFVEGGFGGKNNNQQAVEAARLAKRAGQPVQLMWSREEEFFYDTFRPAAIVKIKAGVADSGRISFWDYGVYFAGQRGSGHFYDIPHHRTTVFGSGWTSAPGTHPFATGPWRAPSNNTNTFARESQIDILASQAGIDPVEFRLNNLQDERMIRVLNAAAKQFGWTPAKAPSGRGFGVALGIDAGTYVAHVADVEVDQSTGRIQVKRVVCAQDMGLCVNPEGAQLQMTGCIMMGLGYALTEEIHFQGGQILDRNFNTYEIPRFSWLPQIETVVIEDREAPPQGGGEPAVIGMGAVIANAVHDATGARLLQLPMTPERIKNAFSVRSRTDARPGSFAFLSSPACGGFPSFKSLPDGCGYRTDPPGLYASNITCLSYSGILLQRACVPKMDAGRDYSFLTGHSLIKEKYGIAQRWGFTAPRRVAPGRTSRIPTTANPFYIS